MNNIDNNNNNNNASVNDIFVEYGCPELDPLRHEICLCIIYGLYQAAITLTNHLLEKSLKHCLIMKYTIEHKKGLPPSIDISDEGIDKFDNKKSDLNKSINQACSQGLITKEQKKILLRFKEEYRDLYSHASSEIYKDMFVEGKVVSTDDLEDGLDNFLKKCFDKSTDKKISVQNNLMAQSHLQVPLAQENSDPYFIKLDKIIRSMLSNLEKYS